jgi:hypothetical protein
MVPHMPQLLGSVAVVTQAPPQFCVFPLHVDVHTPAEQTSFAAHALPHAPQFAGSVAVWTQASPH